MYQLHNKMTSHIFHVAYVVNLNRLKQTELIETVL